MNADEELGYVYLPVASAMNDFYIGHRLVDSLFANSLICMKAETVQRVWNFLIFRHDTWDYDLSCVPNLVHIDVGGKKIKAVVQLTK